MDPLQVAEIIQSINQVGYLLFGGVLSLIVSTTWKG